MMHEADYWIALNMVPRVSKLTLNKLIKHYGGPKEVLAAPMKRLMEENFLSAAAAEAIAKFDYRAQVQIEKQRMEEQGVFALTQADALYPQNLLNISDPPVAIYVRGELTREDFLAVAMVGTRKPTSYGKIVAEKLSCGLARRGVTVVSGLARGIDGISHKGAIDGGGRTIAVLACGLDVVYPPENRALMERIAGNGAIITEFSMGTKPDRFNFPVRNRLISGLSLATVIVEASTKSGSLITARCALDQGREVMAVPGNITSPNSGGTNRLIKDGAVVVIGTEDIIESLPLPVKGLIKPAQEAAKSPDLELSPEEMRIVSLIDGEERHIDEIIEGSGLPASMVSGALVRLELAGAVRQLAGKMFIKNPEI